MTGKGVRGSTADRRGKGKHSGRCRCDACGALEQVGVAHGLPAAFLPCLGGDKEFSELHSKRARGRRPLSRPRARALRRRQPLPPQTYAAAAASHPQGATAGGQPAAPAGPAAAARVPPPPSGGGVRGCTFTVPNPGRKRGQQQRGKGRSARAAQKLDPGSSTKTRCRRAAAGPRASRALPHRTHRPPSGPPPPTPPAMTPICRTRCSRRRSAGSAARSA